MTKKKGTATSTSTATKSVPSGKPPSTVPYKTATGMAKKVFTVYWTHHGPIVRKQGDKWVSIKMMQDPVKALTQSYMRTKAKNYKEFKQTMELHTNSSNNTALRRRRRQFRVYFHGNFIPEAATRSLTGGIQG